MTQDKILIITNGWFPEGDAGAVRLHMVGKALISSGYTVSVLCRGKLNFEGVIDGIRYKSLRNLSGNKLLSAYDYLMFSSKIKKILNINCKDVYAIYIYNAPISVFKLSKAFSKKHSIGLIHDCVEWYSPDEFKNGKNNISYRIKNKINTKILDSSFKIIAISKYLEKYFINKSITAMRLPILCDSELRKNPKNSNGEKLTLFYGGVPLKKDLVGNLIEACLLLAKEEQDKIKIVLVGASKDTLINTSGIAPETIGACTDFLEIYPRMERAELLKLMENADFSVLVRDAELRYAKAGFPSKVVEALANATPVFCNLSSDLSEYLTDGIDSIIADNHTPQALAVALQRAIRLTPEEKNAMSRNALKTAQTAFDYRLYVGQLKKFIG